MADMTLEEALAAATVDDTTTEYCTVDDDTRLVTIPEKYKKLGVESDEKAKRVWFRFPKIVGNNGVDLSAIGVRVNFRNANGDGDIYPVDDLTVDGDYVIFSWELTRKVTAYKGNVSFVVCAVKSATDGTTKNEWNTTLNKECEVLEGLEVSEQIAQENPDIIEYILANLGGSVSAEQIATAVEEYMTAHPFTETDPTVSDWAKQPKKPTYTASEVGADATGTAESKVSEHNTSDTAHDDIRRLIDAIAVPEKLPNPHPLTFTGGVSGSYDGSEAMIITIPHGDGSSISITEETLEGHYLDLWERSVSGLFIVKSGDGEDIIVRAAKSDSSTELGYVITEVATLSPQILCDMKYVERKSVVVGNITVTLYHLYFYDAMTGIYVHQTDKMKGSEPSTFETKAPITDGSIFIQSPDTAEVGQILEVETVDENGKPTAWKTVTIQFPDKLPNPHKLTFSGAVTAEYDGSGAVTVTIPEGGGTGVTVDTTLSVAGQAADAKATGDAISSLSASDVGALPDTTKIPSKTSDLQNDSGFLTEHQDLSGYALKSEVPKSASDVGADTAGTAESKVSAHNTATDSHNDIRELISGLTQRLNVLADSDDTTLDQMSEVVAYIKSNKSLIDAITTSKINVSDIIDNLVTNVSNKPLSAAQGVALKALIDAIAVPTKLSELENDSGYAKTTDIPDKLPNPQKLIFSGAVTAEYDGSGAVTVTIPEGSGGSGGTVRIEKLSTDTAVELEPNKLYIFPEMSELTITLAEPSNTGIANEYHFVFQSGATATTLTIPDTVKIPSGFTVDANKINEISILEGCLCAQIWAVS